MFLRIIAERLHASGGQSAIGLDSTQNKPRHVFYDMTKKAAVHRQKKKRPVGVHDGVSKSMPAAVLPSEDASGGDMWHDDFELLDRWEVDADDDFEIVDV